MADRQTLANALMSDAPTFGAATPQEQAVVPPNILDKLVAALMGDAGNAVMAPGRVFNSTEPMTSDQMIAPAVNMANMLTLGAGAVPAEANSMRMGIKAYHSTYQPFEKYDFSRLGEVTSENTDSEWAKNLAQLGPWASDKSVAHRMAASHTLPVDIGGKGKSFASLDELEAAIRDHGGPQQFRQKMIDDGFGHVKVKDEEFGVNSFVGLSPETFTILKK